MAFNIGKISLGSSAHKRYNHNMSFDNNTTFDFGSVQPLMCQYMMPNSDINVSCKQLVRLAPLVAPSFARVHLQNEASFVPLADVVPYSDALLANLPYSVGNKTYKPTQLPFTTNAMLVYLLLYESRFTYWRVLSGVKYPNYFTPQEVDSDTAKSLTEVLCKDVFGITEVLNMPRLRSGLATYGEDNRISFTSADEVIFLSDGSALTFQFTPIALRLRKIFLGLGYSLNISDRSHVAFAPILAFYKAWFDLYAVKRTVNWTNTACFGLIKHLDDNYVYDFSESRFNVAADTLMAFFIDELAQCWYTYPDDFVSVHRTSVNLTPVAASFVDGSNATSSVFTTSASALGITLTSAPGKLVQNSTTGAPNLYNVALQTLQRLTRFVNKDSIIGQRISEWLRVHYGADVANSVFKQSNHISSSRLDLQINDVFSTSDTANTENGDGEVLGAYAGKGIGFDNSGFSFHTSVSGYVFVMSAVVPESGYFQGNDLTLYGLDRFTLPSADFDALGMELTPKGAIASDNNIVDFRSDSSTRSDSLTNVAFGYVPRFSGYKVKKNIVNGDMSLRSSFDDLSPYYLDRVLTSSYLESEDVVSSASDPLIQILPKITHSTLPVASEEWRYCARYPWLGNYDRLFSNMVPSNATQNDVYMVNRDNFICQSVFDVRVTNALKPISESYDTFEESTDNSSVDVRPE